MTRIVLCSLGDRMHHAPPVYMITVKPCPGLPSFDPLVPTKEMVYGYKHFCGDRRFAGYPPMSEQEYIHAYRGLVMSRLGRIASLYQALPVEHTYTCTFCCYCPAGTFCHRQLVYKLFLWLNHRMGKQHQVELY